MPDVDDGVSFRWGTWEEMLLAFAVSRYGFGRWSSVASELQKRISGQNCCITAENCRRKYIDLKRRYVLQNNEDSEKSNDDEISGSVLEELRKLRVEELRLEVQRYDLNIVSLESKMKSMEDERDGNDATKGTNQSDLEIQNDKNKEPSPGKSAGDELPSTGDSEKDRMSVNGSNSTDPVADKCRTEEKKSEQLDTEDKCEEQVDLKAEPVHDDSCNGSSNSIKKKTAVERGSIDSESESESKEEDDAMKEAWTSDVHSTGSRSRMEGIDQMRRGSAIGEERDHGVPSPPFTAFLQSIWVHKLGSKFQRRLKIQESTKYGNLILQHIDLETIETRLKQGYYGGSATKFFRDLLLLINNALVFFSKNSQEAQAAIAIRKLVSIEMSEILDKSESSSKQLSLQSLNKEETDTSHSLLKPRISCPVFVCRKRSSISVKASLPSSRANAKKKDQATDHVNEEDSKVPITQFSDDAEEPRVTKRRRRDRFPSISVNSKKIGKNPGNQQSKTETPSEQSEPVTEVKKVSPPIIESKKRGAAKFLNRMKQSGVLLDALKNTPLTSDNANNTKQGEKKEQVSRRSSKQTKEKGNPVKRNVGRPRKKEIPPSPPPSSLGKREKVAASKPKKRSRKL